MSAQPMEARIAHLEGAFDQVGDRLNSIDRRLDGFGNEIGGLRTSLRGEIADLSMSVRGEVADLRKDMSQRFNWVIGIVAGTWVTTVGMWITTMLTILYHR